MSQVESRQINEINQNQIPEQASKHSSQLRKSNEQQNRVIDTMRSEEFQDIEISQSQQVSTSFENLTESSKNLKFQDERKQQARQQLASSKDQQRIQQTDQQNEERGLIVPSDQINEETNVKQSSSVEHNQVKLQNSQEQKVETNESHQLRENIPLQSLEQKENKENKENKEQQDLKVEKSSQIQPQNFDHIQRLVQSAQNRKNINHTQFIKIDMSKSQQQSSQHLEQNKQLSEQQVIKHQEIPSITLTGDYNINQQTPSDENELKNEKLVQENSQGVKQQNQEEKVEELVENAQENQGSQTNQNNQEVEQQQQTQQQPKEQSQQKTQQPIQQVDYQSIVSLKIFQKKINQSLEFKNQGNQFFKVNNYEDAIKKYSQGLRVLDPKQFYGATHAECQKMAQVSASLLFNVGCCFFNLNSWRNAQIYFTQTLTINPEHIKAQYKRALCRYQIQNYEGSMSDIKQTFNKDKSNTQIHKSYQKILQKYNQQVRKQKESLKQMSSKIFRKDSQKSLSQSQVSQKQVKENPATDRSNNEENEQNKGGISDLWGFAPLVLVAGVALLFGYKKWIAK